MIVSVLLAALVTLGQCLFLMLMAPLLTDIEHGIEGLIGGRTGVFPGWRWRQIASGWKRQGAIPAASWLCVCPVLLAATGIPLASTGTMFGFLSEPLACGILLIVSCVPVWIQARQAAPTRMIARRLHTALSELSHDLLFILPLLALTGTLITVGLPGAGTLIGLLQQRLVQPAPALLGGLVFLALALLLVLNRHFLSSSLHDDLIAATEGRHRALLRYRHDLSASCWYLLIADLVWPDLIAVGPTGLGHLALLWCVVAPAKLALVVVLGVGWRIARPLPSARLAFVLTGAAILLVLAGRLTP
ncbi:hypothetical protein [Asaia astilbis]|uniref:hypothetical protein n=1 Tax=Asaia astilbis TaxID=610244 RepID=UPI000471196D|nr:hypothetical protein [Asaia astilbis]